MITFYHGSPNLFEKFDLSKVGNGTGLKYGFGIYLSEAEASANHYSQPRHSPLAPDHYLYTVEFMPELTEDNHLISAKPVHPAIIQRAEAKLGKSIPTKVTLTGLDFRVWIGYVLTGSKDKKVFERPAAEFLDGIGVICNIWPRAQVKPELYNGWADIKEKFMTVFNDKYVRIVKVEHIEVFNSITNPEKSPHWDLVPGTRKLVAEYK